MVVDNFLPMDDVREDFELPEVNANLPEPPVQLMQVRWDRVESDVVPVVQQDIPRVMLDAQPRSYARAAARGASRRQAPRGRWRPREPARQAASVAAVNSSVRDTDAKAAGDRDAKEEKKKDEKPPEPPKFLNGGEEYHRSSAVGDVVMIYHKSAGGLGYKWPIGLSLLSGVLWKLGCRWMSTFALAGSIATNPFVFELLDMWRRSNVKKMIPMSVNMPLTQQDLVLTVTSKQLSPVVRWASWRNMLFGPVAVNAVLSRIVRLSGRPVESGVVVSRGHFTVEPTVSDCRMASIRSAKCVDDRVRIVKAEIRSFKGDCTRVLHCPEVVNQLALRADRMDEESARVVLSSIASRVTNLMIPTEIHREVMSGSSRIGEIMVNQKLIELAMCDATANLGSKNAPGAMSTDCSVLDIALMTTSPFLLSLCLMVSFRTIFPFGTRYRVR